MSTALYNHCNTMYSAMIERAQERTEGLVYEGSLSKLFDEVGLGSTYYTPVMTALRRMGCVEQLRRGGGPSPSVWALYHAPTEELFNEMRGDVSFRRSAPGRKELEQRLRDLHKRLQGLENWARRNGAPV